MGLLLLAAGLAASMTAPPALARRSRSAVTKMKLSLDSHEVAVGDTVTASVQAFTRGRRSWAPLAGAPVTFTLDGVAIGEAITDAEGRASISFTADSEGEHAVKAFYAGDSQHKRAKRAQGFEVFAPVHLPPEDEGAGEEVSAE